MMLLLLPECLRGWLDYPGHSPLFPSPFCGVPRVSGGLSRHYSCGHPTGISFQVLSWRRLSSRMVSSDYSFRHPTGISFQDRPWCHLTPDRHFCYILLVLIFIFCTKYYSSCHVLIPVSMHLI